MSEEGEREWELTSDVLLFVLLHTPLLHLHNSSLNATVVDVTEILSILLYTFGHWVSHSRCEATLALLKVLVISDLLDNDMRTKVLTYDFSGNH